MEKPQNIPYIALADEWSEFWDGNGSTTRFAVDVVRGSPASLLRFIAVKREKAIEFVERDVLGVAPDFLGKFTRPVLIHVQQLNDSNGSLVSQ